jgi:hypothetical protein
MPRAAVSEGATLLAGGDPARHAERASGAPFSSNRAGSGTMESRHLAWMPGTQRDGPRRVIGAGWNGQRRLQPHFGLASANELANVAHVSHLRSCSEPDTIEVGQYRPLPVPVGHPPVSIPQVCSRRRALHRRDGEAHELVAQPGRARFMETSLERGHSRAKRSDGPAKIREGRRIPDWAA